MLDGLFPEDVAIAWGDPLEPSKPLFPEEEAQVARAVEKRRLEFAKGRECARTALSSFGRGDVILLSGKSREPLWPEGIVGSITHTRGLCGVAVGRSERYRGIGIDAEPAEPLGLDVAERVCREDERAALSELGVERAISFRLLFSAKEAIYKCLYPIARTFLGFEDVAVAFGEGTFRARIHAAWPASLPPDSHISGRWRCAGAHLVTAAWIERHRKPLP